MACKDLVIDIFSANSIAAISCVHSNGGAADGGIGLGAATGHGKRGVASVLVGVSVIKV